MSINRSSLVGFLLLGVIMITLPLIVFFSQQQQQTQQHAAGNGTLYWSADFETGNLSSFAGVHVGNSSGYNWGNSSATVLSQGGTITGLNNDGSWTAPTPRSGRYAAGLLVDGPSSNASPQGTQRAELTSSYHNSVSTERYYGLSVYIPSNPNIVNGNALTQDYAIWQAACGTSLALQMTPYKDQNHNNTYFILGNSANPQNGWAGTWYRINPIKFDQWIDFTIHVYWATDSTGYFEIYENGQVVTLNAINVNWSGTRAYGPTYGSGCGSVIEYDWYRYPQSYPNLLYLDELKIGDTYTIVQPSSLSTSTPTQTQQSGTETFFLTLCPHGIGNCGDNANPNSSGNTSPNHISRNVTLIFLGTDGNQIASAKGIVTYNSAVQNYQGNISVPTLSSGQYLISIKMDGFLGKQIPGIVSVLQGQRETLPEVSLVNGDINNDNQLDIQDYNILISCFGSKQQTSTCLAPPTVSSPGADIDDHGAVDGTDYNLFLRELSVQHGG